MIKAAADGDEPMEEFEYAANFEAMFSSPMPKNQKFVGAFNEKYTYLMGKRSNDTKNAVVPVSIIQTHDAAYKQ